MGQKSRQKRERRKLAALDAALDAALRQRGASEAEGEFERQSSDLAALFSQYNADDVYVSLCVSDLWLPNVSSQVKHTFAFCVAASMQSHQFTVKNTIDTYAKFEDFIKQVYALLPPFPTLEDYIPELDWGEVKTDSMGSLVNMYYGASIERIPDFITAFQILHGHNISALQDMHAALSIQHHVISSIDRNSVGVAEDLEPGYIEVPAEPFWVRCRDAVISASALPETSCVSHGLVSSPGQRTPPRDWMEFGDAILTGSALPSFLLDFGGRRYPMSLRNAPGTVMQYWADRQSGAELPASAIAAAIGAFLSQRFDTNSVIPGPFQLVSHSQRLPFVFGAAMMGGPKVHLIIALSEASLAKLPEIVAAVGKLLGSPGEWAMQRLGESGATQIRRADGALPTLRDVVVVAVLACRVTSNGLVKLPKTKARVLPLPDFVSIYDSVESVEELDRFWSFVDQNAGTISGYSSIADRFAAFRDSHALLADGAVSPDFIGLDPHWGTNWRYQYLSEAWLNAPPLFPNNKVGAWKARREHDELYRLEAKCGPVLSWCTVIRGCVVHFLFDLTDQPALGPDDGRTLELVVHCLADTLAQRRETLSSLPLFFRRRLVTVCRADPSLLATGADEAVTDGHPLFSQWDLISSAEDELVQASVTVNLQRVRQRVTNPVDAAFEAEAAIAWVNGLSELLGIENDPVVLEEVSRSRCRRPRFTLTELPRLVDVPDVAHPVVPDAENYKTARRDLAIVFRELGASPGKYELAEAKALIDPAREKFGHLVHRRIAALNRNELVVFCIEQLDALIGRFDSTSKTVEISLSHDVSYNRTEKLADAHKRFVRESRNYRYLLECCLSLSSSGSDRVTSQKAVEIVASIDWLHVLHDASDTLHNGIDVAGLELNQFFVPEIYYSKDREERERSFAAEMADLKLGIGVTPADQISVFREESADWRAVDNAFLHDVGVRLSDFVAGLIALSRWSTYSKDPHLAWSYSAPRERVRDVLVNAVTDLTAAGADRIISLATIDPSGIRRLIGKSTDETDVPTWEHNKRGNRFTIKPLIEQNLGIFVWGAASAERAARIWSGSIADGFLPADFNWPHIVDTVRTVKSQLEGQLETTALTVVRRGTPYAIGGIDFKRQFPQERFEDVGDYDVLAYWHGENRWLVVECKYNQPAFCLKDARRLRDRIFGTEKNRAQLAKIERRRRFLSSNIDRVRSLLDWPSPSSANAATITEVYVSKNIYWWMRNPPYQIPTHFVRVDVLDHWLRKNGLLD